MIMRFTQNAHTKLIIGQVKCVRIFSQAIYNCNYERFVGNSQAIIDRLNLEKADYNNHLRLGSGG